MSTLRSKLIYNAWIDFDHCEQYNDGTMQEQFTILQIFCEFYNKNILNKLCDNNKLHTMECQRIVEGLTT